MCRQSAVATSMPALRLFFDGGCRPNPGQIEIAVVVRGVVHVVPDCGQGNNSDAEWLAAIHALTIAAAMGAREVDLLGDSTLVVTQANGTARCRSDALRAHRDAFRVQAAAFDRVRLRHVGRARNLAGIALARLHPR